jgi:hypothetical protein
MTWPGCKTPAPQREDRPLDAAPDFERRTLLAGLTAALMTACVPSATAQEDVSAARRSFAELSNLLTGRSTLDATHADVLYDALVASRPHFDSEVRALLTLMQNRTIDPKDLQRTLDGERSPLAALPRAIVSAWYLGVVGEGERARCVTFESSLSYEIVSDRLSPPSYCHGGPASWVEKP